MPWIDQHILSLLIATPVVTALLLALVPGGQRGILKGLALLGGLAAFVLSLHLVCHWHEGSDYQFIENVAWIPNLGIRYIVGIDGISLWLILLTTLLMPIVLVFSMGSIKEKEKQYYIFMLLLEAGMLGAFSALDCFLFYIFWEAMLIPMYFLIGIYGSKRRIYAAVKFFLFTMVGSVLMLLAMIYLYYQADRSFQLANWMQLSLSPKTQLILFSAFALSFAIKVPMFPLHTWLPDAHTEAPTAGSVILAGVLLKMGTYGLLRFNLALFPDQAKRWAFVFITLAVIGIIYGALVAMVQPDVKRLVAYSSVSHMGFVVLGLFSFTELGMQGALYQMLNHGVSTGALFLFVGFIYERRHTRMISEFGGLAKPMPWFSTLFVIASLSSIGLPFLNGFVGEFLILIGTWTSQIIGHAWIVTMLAATGVIWAAVYMLWMLQRVVFGPVTNPENERLFDLNSREIGLLLPLLFLMLFMGVYPRVFLDRSKASVETVQRRVSPPAGGSYTTSAGIGSVPQRGSVGSVRIHEPQNPTLPRIGTDPIQAQRPNSTVVNSKRE